MSYNSYKPWTDQDIYVLEKLYDFGYSTKRIARCMERTPRAVEHAIKHMLIQQCIQMGTKEVAQRYNIPEESFHTDLVPSKYYIHPEVSDENAKNTCGPFSIVMSFFAIYLCVVTYGYMYPLLESNA